MNIATNGDFDILFLGDSITDLWNVEADPQGNPGGKRVFNKYFGDVKVANFGISGDTTQGVLWRLQNGEGKGHKPKAVMLMLGTNNTGGSLRRGNRRGHRRSCSGTPQGFSRCQNHAPGHLSARLRSRAMPIAASARRPTKSLPSLMTRKHVFFTDINSKFLDDQTAA